jgi:hypothetical protein
MPDSASINARFCSQCGQAVTVLDASYCKECGAPLAGTLWLSHEITWRPFTAFILSLVPGLGQFYKGRHSASIVWFLGVIFAYQAAPSLGLLLHLICAGNAAFAGAIREEAVARSARAGTSRGLPAAARRPQ